MESSCEFPEFYPDGCPPVDAEAREVLAYRFSNNLTLTEEDFKSVYETKTPYREPDNSFMRFGVSLWTNTPVPISKLKKLSTVTKKYKYIHEGITLSYEGLIKINNCTQHLTWWLYKNKFPHKHFKLVNPNE